MTCLAQPASTNALHLRVVPVRERGAELPFPLHITSITVTVELALVFLFPRTRFSLASSVFAAKTYMYTYVIMSNSYACESDARGHLNLRQLGLSFRKKMARRYNIVL